MTYLVTVFVACVVIMAIVLMVCCMIMAIHDLIAMVREDLHG